MAGLSASPVTAAFEIGFPHKHLLTVCGPKIGLLRTDFIDDYKDDTPFKQLRST
jgi:hypothetical protein